MKCLISSVIFLICAADAVHLTVAKPSDSEHDGRIVGGWKVRIEDFPHHVSLLTKKNNYICGGSVIKQNYILTAGHCIGKIHDGYIRVGSNHSVKRGNLHHIVSIVRHDNYTNEDPFGISNDIAIIKVEPPFLYNSAVMPVKLYGEQPVQNLTVGELCTATGFGTIYESGPRSENLLGVSVSIVSNVECTEFYSRIDWAPITENRFCAGFPEGGKDTCQGDSGGPVMYNGYQVGIVSYGYGCARADYPGIYTYVPHFLDWIKKHTSDEEL